MTSAPEKPTTADLHAMHPFSAEAGAAVLQMRALASQAIRNYQTTTIGIAGYCARPGLAQQAEIMRESGMVAEIHDPETGLIAMHRGPMWKPRTKPEDWHGEETTDPEGAYLTMRDQAERYANLAVEIGRPYHLHRYGHLLSFIWTGGRNVDNDVLIEETATIDPSIPLAIKNNLDGTIDKALEQVERATKLRGAHGAPVILLYRGGLKAQTPEEWEEVVMEVHERTKGRFILDTAHGTEMAHDPDQKFSKSVDGQVLAVYAMNRLARQGYSAAGVMMEASRLESPTDPHMPLELALEGLKEHHRVKASPIERQVVRLQTAYH